MTSFSRSCSASSFFSRPFSASRRNRHVSPASSRCDGRGPGYRSPLRGPRGCRRSRWLSRKTRTHLCTILTLVICQPRIKLFRNQIRFEIVGLEKPLGNKIDAKLVASLQRTHHRQYGVKLDRLLNISHSKAYN